MVIAACSIFCSATSSIGDAASPWIGAAGAAVDVTAAAWGAAEAASEASSSSSSSSSSSD